jgi:hypothetical protein
MKKLAVIAGLVVWVFSGDWLLGLQRAPCSRRLGLPAG